MARICIEIEREEIHMKKLLTFASAMMLTLTFLSGCSNNNEANNQPAGEVTWEDQLATKGKIAIGISPDYPPFESLTTDGEMIGFDVDMANELAKYLGSEEAPYEIEWVKMSFDLIVSAVQSGQVDAGVAGFTYDPERDVLFSDSYLDSSQVILVKADSGIKTVEDLNGKLIGVQLGSTGEMAASEIEGATLQSVKDVKMMIEAVKADTVDAVVVDQAVAKGYADGKTLTILETPLREEENSVIVAKQNEALVEKINEAIASFKASDTYQELKTQWGM